MKRQRKTWKEKIDAKGLRFLEACREARKVAPTPTTNLKDLIKEGNPVGEIFSRYPDLAEAKEVHLAPDFLRVMKGMPGGEGISQEGRMLYPARLGEIFEWMQFIHSVESDPRTRLALHFFVSLWGVIIKDFIKNLRTMEYGQEPLDNKKLGALAAQFFEIVAGLCRGRFDLPKGRIDTTQIGLINTIQSHQKEVLTAEDLKQALAYVGVTVPEGEAWRLWLWRAKRKGLIKGVTSSRNRSVTAPRNPSLRRS